MRRGAATCEACRFRAMRQQSEKVGGLLPDSKGQNIALHVLYVPCSLKRGLPSWRRVDAYVVAVLFVRKLSLWNVEHISSTVEWCGGPRARLREEAKLPGSQAPFTVEC